MPKNPWIGPYLPAMLSDDVFWQDKPRVVKPQPKHICALPGCGKETSGKAYCSADHCREHKERQRHEQAP